MINKVKSWIYNQDNDNEHILLLILVLIILFAFSFDFFKTKSDYIAKPEYKKTTKDKFNNISNTNNTTNTTNTTNITTYQPSIETNLFITEEEKKQWQIANELLDGNQDTLQNTNGSSNVPKNDILQINSTLFNSGYTNPPIDNFSTVGDYATVDTLGKGLTDTLGGIDTVLGFTVLEEQLGTFTNKEIPNPHTYDNTSDYHTGMTAKTVSGNNNNYRSKYGSELYDKQINDNNKQPIFLQKDFDGVANIFAPNIIIQNPPLTSDGYPDISFQM